MIKYYLCPYCKTKKEDPQESKLVCMSTWDFKNNCEDKDALPVYLCSDCGRKFTEAELKKSQDQGVLVEEEESREDIETEEVD